MAEAAESIAVHPSPASPPRVRHWLAVLVGCLLVSACAPIPRHGTSATSTGHLAYSLDGPAAAPAIVLQSGLGDDRSTWHTVWSQLATRRRVFAIDRPGYGQSPSSTAPRDPCHAALELHAALQDAKVPPPYLLVGHSLGGLYQVAFARLFPAETAGVLLLDPTHPDHWPTLQRDTPRTAAVLSNLRQTVFTATMRSEFDAQAQCLETLPPWPAAVPSQLLFSGRFNLMEPDDYQRALMRLRQDWQQRLGAAVETVPNSGHYLHQDAPQRVLQVLDRLLEKAVARPTAR